MEGEIRQNKVTKEWVIFAPARSQRPHDLQHATPPKPERPPHSAACPFCPGNEERLPGVIAERPGPNGQEWLTRVVPNRYPVLMPEGSTTRREEGLYVSMQGYGHHEVVIDSPRHDHLVSTMDPAHVRSLIETYHARYTAHLEDERNLLILIFRNHGARAGASLEHPHSQVVTAGLIPREVRWRNLEAQRYHDELGRCVYCDILAQEEADGRRVVLENEAFLAFVPYAADTPFEVWIVPRRHQATFGETTEAERAALADALRAVLGRLNARLNDPDHNYVINSASRYVKAPHLHWYLRVRPRLVTRAGFEIGSGMRINPSLPEADAAFLRAHA